MAPLLADTLTACYLAAGFGFAAVYVPRIRRMLRDDAATSLSHSLQAESLWTICRLVSLAYVATIAAEPVVSLVVFLDLLGRFAVLAVIARARARCAVMARPA